MRILILGGDGMLGHQLFAHLRQKHDTRITLRQTLDAYAGIALLSPDAVYPGIDVRASEPLRRVLEDLRPDAVVNAVGIVKQQPVATDSIANIEINALLPH